MMVQVAYAGRLIEVHMPRWPADHVKRPERLRQEIERGWLALGIRRNPQHDVTIADGINRLREQHAARLAEIEEA